MFSPDGALHFSALKHIGKSPMHYACAVQRTDWDSPGMRIGRAVHGLVLVDQAPRVFEGDRRGTKWKEFVAEYALENAPQYDEDQRCTNAIGDVLTRTEWDKVQLMRDALYRNPIAMALLSQCEEREAGIEWTRNGYRCKGRIDARSIDRRVMLDLKTCKDASQWHFLRDAHRMSYHAQLPWYDNGQGVEVCGPDTKWADQYIIALENTAPYAVQVYKLDPLRIDQGWEETEKWMDTFCRCMEENKFTRSYSDQIVIWDAEIKFTEDEEEDEE